ncbi:MAG TPA: hypothetical protein VLR10_01195, partial [Nitrososphaeraceae archaeon]|nr:hypothetical protein [Nitrososphaeraceae archaeon]
RFSYNHEYKTFHVNIKKNYWLGRVFIKTFERFTARWMLIHPDTFAPVPIFKIIQPSIDHIRL